MTLALFDTDKTILDVGTLVERAFSNSTNEHVGRRFKFKQLAPKEYQGVSMQDIFLTWLKKHDDYLPHVTEQLWPKVRKTYEDNLIEMLRTQGRPRKFQCAGAESFLSTLQAASIGCGVYSQAPLRVHRASLDATGLRPYFLATASDGQAQTRAGLIEHCHKQIEASLDRRIQKREIVVFGDAPKDAIAARQYGVRSVLVTRYSSFTKEDLETAEADFMYNSFEEADQIMSDVFNL